MKTTILLLALLLGVVCAQGEVVRQLTEPATQYAPLRYQTYGEEGNRTRNAKTNAGDLDTIGYHWDRCDVPGNVSSFLATPIGYYNGTRGLSTFTSSGGSVERYVAEHGVTLEIPQRQGLVSQIVGVFGYFTDQSRIIGQADSFRVSILSFPTGSTSATFLSDQKYFLGDLVIGLEWTPGTFSPYQDYNLAPLAEPVTVGSGRHIVMMEVNNANSNDTLVFHFTTPNIDCDPGNENDWVIMLRDENFENPAFQYFNSTYLEPGSEAEFDVPGIIPVVEYVDPTAVNIPLQKGGLHLEQLINDPAAGIVGLDLRSDRETNLQFSLSTLTGQTVATSTMHAMPGQIYSYRQQTDGLAGGMYMLTVRGENAFFTKKILIP